MKVSVLHPVPVRWRPPRARRDRLELMAATTAAEIPELPASAFAGPERVARVGDKARAYVTHGGRTWARVTLADLDAGPGAGRDGTAPASPVQVAGFLGRRSPRPFDGLALNGGPLSGVLDRYGMGADLAVGLDLPDAAAEAARSGNMDAAASAVRRLLAEEIAVAGDAVYMRACPPVVTPGRDPCVGLRLPWHHGWGPCFAPHDVDALDDYMERARIIFPPSARWAAARIEGDFGPEDYGDADLGRFVQGAGAVLDDIVALVERHWGLRGATRQTMPEVGGAALGRFRPFGDLGRVGAIPREDWPEAVDLLVRAVEAVRESLPSRYCPQDFPRLRVYANHFAKPRTDAMRAAAAEADADTIAGLAP